MASMAEQAVGPMTTQIGTFAMNFSLPHPWPIKIRKKAAELQLSDGIFQLWYEVFGQIRLIVYRSNGGDRPEKLHDVFSCRIENKPYSPILLFAEWSGEGADIVLSDWENDQIVGTSRMSVKAVGQYCVKERILDLSKQVSLSDLNDRAIEKRRSNLRRWAAAPRHTDLGERYVIDNLRIRTRLLSIALENIKEGDVDYMVQLAGMLRTLIADKTARPMPLLQQAALLLDVPLIVYTSGNPIDSQDSVNAHKIRAMAHMSFKKSMHEEPAFLWTNAVDLDVWRDRIYALVTPDDRMTNGKLLWEVGSDNGAHFARDILESIRRLKEYSSELGEYPGDMLLRYLTDVGRIVLILARRVLDTASRSAEDALRAGKS